MAPYHSCFLSLILYLVVAVSSASEVNFGDIPKPEYTIPEDRPQQNPSGLRMDNPTIDYNKPTDKIIPEHRVNPTPVYHTPESYPTPKHKKPMSSPSPVHKMPMYNHPFPMYKRPHHTPMPIYRKPVYTSSPIYKKPMPTPMPVYAPPIYRNPRNESSASAPATAPANEPHVPPSSPPSPTQQSPNHGAPPPYKSLDYIPAPYYVDPTNEPHIRN